MRYQTSALALAGSLCLVLLFSCKKDNDDSGAGGGGNGTNPPAGCQATGTVTDIDGHVYPVVTIGSQQWMAENLRTTRYRDGSAIPNVTDNTAWSELTTDAWCNYLNEPANDAIYGKLYNWYAVSEPGICPQGWHLPSDAEWKHLESALGMSTAEVDLFNAYRGGGQNVGGKMKATTLWIAPNTGATNASCFAALPSGLREDEDGSYFSLGITGGWWSATVWESNPGDAAYYRYLSYQFGAIARTVADNKIGLCVRCVMD